MSVDVRKCTHIKVNGIKCGSPALKISDRCYFHDQAFRRLRISVLQKPPIFPVLEDANSIQVAIMDIMNDLRYDHIEPKLAGKLLYALQIASYNLKRMDLDRQDTVQELPANWHPVEPLNLPRWGATKLPYDGEPDPTLPNYKPASPATAPTQSPASSCTESAPSTVAPASRRQELSTDSDTCATPGRHPERECAPKREALGAIESRDLVSTVLQHDTRAESAPSTVAPASRRQSPSTDADPCLVSGHDFSRAETEVKKSGASAPAKATTKQSSASHKRPSRSSTTDSMPSLPAIQQKIARAKAGNVRAARELFELAGLMPRQ